MAIPTGLPSTTSFKVIEDCVGYHAAFLLCKKFGGLEKQYIPKNPKMEHHFRTVIGDEKFSRLAEGLGGLRIDIPKAAFITSKKASIMDAILVGDTTRAIAIRYRVSMRYVRMIRQELRKSGVNIPDNSLLPGYLRER